MKFASNAEEIRYYTKELLSDNKEHTVQEIKEYVSKQSIKEFTDGTYSGSLRDLVAKEDGYENPRRGIYICKSNGDGLITSSYNIIQESIEKLYLEISKLNILNVTKEDLNTVEKMKESIIVLEQIRDKFRPYENGK